MTVNYKHNERGYFDIYNKLVNAYPNKPTWMFKEIAGMAEFQSDLMNNIAIDIFHPRTRESAYAFATRCGYDPVEADGCTTDLTLTLSSQMSKTIPAGYQFGGESSLTGNFVYFEVVSDTSVVDQTQMTVSVKQKKSISDHIIDTIDSQEDFYEIPIDSYTGIIKDSISLVINSLTWTRVDNFDNSTSTDRHFMLIYQSNGKTRVVFGDGTYGLKPDLNEVVTASFEITEGLNGVMDAGEIDVNVGEDTDISSVTNSSATNGGNNSESVASILRNAKAFLRQKGIVWSEEDLELAAKQSSSSVVKALGIGGVGNATIYIVPSGGGNPDQTLKDTVQDYVESSTQFGVMPVSVLDPVYQTQDITATITIRNGFDTDTVLNLTRWALRFTVCSFDNQIIEHYTDNGIDSTRTTFINVLWAYSFTEDDNEALEFIIQQWIEILGSKEYREWGQGVEVGDLWVMGNLLYNYGVDLFSLTSPIVNVSVSSTTLISEGTITVTEA